MLEIWRTRVALSTFSLSGHKQARRVLSADCITLLIQPILLLLLLYGRLGRFLMTSLPQ